MVHPYLYTSVEFFARIRSIRAVGRCIFPKVCKIATVTDLSHSCLQDLTVDQIIDLHCKFQTIRHAVQTKQQLILLQPGTLNSQPIGVGICLTVL